MSAGSTWRTTALAVCSDWTAAKTTARRTLASPSRSSSSPSRSRATGAASRRPEKELQADAAQVQGATGGGGLCHQGGWGRVEASLERPASSSQLATVILFHFFYAKYISDLSLSAPFIIFSLFANLGEVAGLSENVACEFCCFGLEYI